MADWCWSEYRRDSHALSGYVLRYLAAHLTEAGRWDDLSSALLGPRFLEAKTEAGLVFDLVQDCNRAIARMPSDDQYFMPIFILAQALRYELHFVARHPSLLFQVLWNRAWWYDSPAASDHYSPPVKGWPPEGPPWKRSGPKLYGLMEQWRRIKEEKTPGFRWVRSLRPPDYPLGSDLQAIFSGHRDVVDCMDSSPDGRQIVSGSRDRTARIWDAESGRVLATLVGHEGLIFCVRFSPDGRRIVTGSSDGTARIWDAGRGTELARITVLCESEIGYKPAVSSASFTPDGQRVLIVPSDGSIRIWEPESSTESKPLIERQLKTRYSAISRDCRRIFVVLPDPDSESKPPIEQSGTIAVFDARSGVEVVEIENPAFRWGLSCITLAPDGRRFAIGYRNEVWVWHAESGALIIKLIGHGAGVNSVAFASDGRRIVSGSKDCSIRLWDAETGDNLAIYEDDGYGMVIGADLVPGVNAVSFSPDGRRILSGSSDHTVKIWDANPKVELARREGHALPIQVVAFAPDGRRIATGSLIPSVSIWDVGSGKRIMEIDAQDVGARPSIINGVAFAPDGRRIVTGSSNACVRIWDSESGAELTNVAHHYTSFGDGLTRVAFSSDGRRVVGGDYYTVRIWDAHSGTELADFRVGGQFEVGREGTISSLAFAPDGRRTALGLSDGVVRIWDLKRRWIFTRFSGHELACLSGHEGVVQSVAFDESGRNLASASWDGTMRVWDVASGACLRVIEGNGDVRAVAAGPAVSRYWAISHNSETMIVNSADGEEIAFFPVALHDLTTHPSGRLWAGFAGTHLYLIQLEGDPAP
jgi:WD40 repeat protein